MRIAGLAGRVVKSWVLCHSRSPVAISIRPLEKGTIDAANGLAL